MKTKLKDLLIYFYTRQNVDLYQLVVACLLALAVHWMPLWGVVLTWLFAYPIMLLSRWVLQSVVGLLPRKSSVAPKLGIPK